MSITQSTQYAIKSLVIESSDGTGQYDVRAIFEEINLFDSMLLPCMSGSLVLRDAVGLTSKVRFDGSEYLHVKIQKDPDNPNLMWIDRRFRIYKQPVRQAINQSSELIILNFVSDEMLLSKQKKITQKFSGQHSQIIERILKDYLVVGSGPGELGLIESTQGIHDYYANNQSPFDVIESVTKRSVSKDNIPNYMFWQTYSGYNFLSLSTIMRQDTLAEIDFGTKNLCVNSDNPRSEILGARDIRVVSQMDYAKNIESGVYASKFIGFDPMTRTIAIRNVDFNNVYGSSSHANPNSVNSSVLNKESKPANVMYDSRVVVYPFEYFKTSNDHLKKNIPAEINKIDDSHNYAIQRKAILANLLQKRLRVTMPGNFRLWSGSTVMMNVPNRFSNTTTIAGDKSVRGKYVITAVRHIIRFDRHETVLEVATDSTYQEK